MFQESVGVFWEKLMFMIWKYMEKTPFISTTPISWKTANLEKASKIAEWCSSRKSTVPALFIYQKAYCINHAFQNYYSLKIKQISSKSKSPCFPTGPCHSNQSPWKNERNGQAKPKGIVQALPGHRHWLWLQTKGHRHARRSETPESPVTTETAAQMGDEGTTTTTS